MGTVNAWWSGQVWNDPNCYLNISWDTLKNDDNFWYERSWYVNGVIQHDEIRENAAMIPIPGSQAWRYSAGTTFQQIIRAMRSSTGLLVDSANWGPGAFPYPPTPPGAATPLVAATPVAGLRNTWDLQAWNGANVHRIYVADSANGEPIYANVTGAATARYTLPVGVRSATFRGRAVNVGPYGAEGPVADAFITLNSSNAFPSAPSPFGATPSRLLAGLPVDVTWTHVDANSDPQTKYQLAYKRVAGPGLIQPALQEQTIIESAQGSAQLTLPGPGKYEIYVRTWDWEGYSGAWSAAATVEVVRSLVRESGLWAPATHQVKVNGVWTPTVKIKL